MKQALNQTIQAQGLQALQSPQQLCEQLLAAGAAPGEAITLELILNNCPSIVAVLSQGEISRAEANAMVSTVVRSTSLSPAKVRQILGELFQACGIKILTIPMDGTEVVRTRKFKGTVASEQEGAELRAAWYELQKNTDSVEALAKLEDLAEAGNAYANYLMGEYYYSSDRTDGMAQGKEYYRRAAELGYGPAFGALADYEISGPRRNLSKAATYFTHPTALAGSDGRKWSTNAVQLLTYRGENKSRIWIVLLLSLAMFGISLIPMLFSAPVVWNSLAALGAVGCVCRCLFAWILAPYQSQRGTYGALLVCWLFLVFSLI